MSLGIKSVWRAHACLSTARGFSLIPRECLHGQLRASQTQQVRFATTNLPDIIRRVYLEKKEPLTIEKKNSNDSEELGTGGTSQPGDASPSVLRRALLRKIVRNKVGLETANSVLVTPVEHYDSKHAAEKSHRKHMKSKARQDLWAHARQITEKRAANWNTVVEFLSKLTPKFGTIFDFKVTVGRGAASDVRNFVPKTQTAVGIFQQSTQAIVRLDGFNEDDGTLNLMLTGSEHSIRMCLLDLLKASGQITAVRVLDSDSEGMLHDLWQDKHDQLSSVKLLGKADTLADDKTLTVRKEQESTADGSSKRRHYTLTRRADDIPQPAVWTRSSTESYIASLVYGVVPGHLHAQLYGNGKDHQSTVVSLLLDVFFSLSARRTVSTEALAMSIRFVQQGGLALRPAARAIFNQAEIADIPFDSRICNLLLLSSGLARDLDGFDAILKMMARKGYHANSESWLVLLEMTEDIKAKRMVLGRMRGKGLDRIQSALIKAGRHMATSELERDIKKLQSIHDFVAEHDSAYGPRWLDTITLNRLLNTLGMRGRHDLISELLDLVFKSKRAAPDTVTLNTILTHTRGIPDMIATLRLMQLGWSSITLDEVSFDILFRTGWDNRNVNMLRVIWIYACFAQRASSKLRARISMLLHEDKVSDRQILLKTWVDTIIGSQELAAWCGITDISKCHIRELEIVLNAHATMWRPIKSLADQLAEAYDMDRKVHAANKAGEIMTTSLKKSLTVDIPLERRQDVILPPPSSSATHEIKGKSTESRLSQLPSPQELPSSQGAEENRITEKENVP